MIYILKHRAQRLLARNNAPPRIRKPPHRRRLSHTTANVRIRCHWGPFVKPLLSWNINKYFIFWVCVRACVRSLSYTICNAHAPFYILFCGLSASTIYFHIISLAARFSVKMLLHITCVWFSLQRLSEMFLILSRIQRDSIVNVHWYSCKVLVLLSRF